MTDSTKCSPGVDCSGQAGFKAENEGRRKIKYKGGLCFFCKEKLEKKES